LLEVFAQVSVGGGKLVIGLGQTFRLQGMEDLSIVNSGDKPIGNGTDGFIEVHLSGESIESGLRGEWWVLRGNYGLDWVEGDG
jgi:hypothetical protein